MNTPIILISAATILVIASLFYLRSIAQREGVKQEKEHWMVFGVFAGMIAVSGFTKENLWLALIGLLLAVFGVVYHARVIIGLIKAPRKERG